MKSLNSQGTDIHIPGEIEVERRESRERMDSRQAEEKMSMEQKSKLAQSMTMLKRDENHQEQ